MHASSPPVVTSWRRDFLLLFTGAGLATTATRATGAAYPLLLLALTGSPVLAGWARFCSMIPHLIFTLPFGAVVDRYDRRRLLMIAQLGRAVTLAVVTLAVLTGETWTPVLFAAIFVEGVFTVLHQLALDPAIVQVVPQEHISWAVSRNEGAQHSANLLGQPVGGFLIGLNHTLPFLGGLVAQVVSAVTILSIGTKRLDAPQASTDRTPGRAWLLTGIGSAARWIWRDAFLRLATSLFTTTNVLWQLLALLIIVLAQSQGASAAVIGLVLGATGVGGVAGTLLAPRIARGLPPRFVLRMGPWCWLGAVVMVAFANGPWGLSLAWACVGLIAGIMDVTTVTYMLKSTPPELLGRVASIPRLLCFGLSPLGALASGYLIELAGPHTTLAVAGVVMAAIAVFATLYRFGPVQQDLAG